MSQSHNHLNHATWECKYHVVFTPKVAADGEAKLEFAGWWPYSKACPPDECAVVQTDLPLGVPTRGVLGNEICKLCLYDFARPGLAVMGEVATDQGVAVQFDQKVEVCRHERREC